MGGGVVLYGLLLVTLLGAALRLVGLPQQGFLHWDEAGLMLEARYWLNGLQDLPALVSGRASGSAPFYGRPTDIAFIALATQAVGDSALAGQLTSALFGTLTIPLVFAIGAVISGPRIGLIAASLLAFLPYHVMYSRLAFAEASATFLVYLALLVRLIGLRSARPSSYYLAPFLYAVLLGLAATANYRLWLVVAVLLFAELLLFGWARGAAIAGEGPRTLKRMLAHIGLLVVGTSIAPLTWEGMFFGLRLYAAQNGLPYHLTSYVRQLQALIGYYAERVSFGGDYTFYIKSLWMFGTPVFTLLVFTGAILLTSNMVVPRTSESATSIRPRALVVFFGFLLPFALFSSYAISATRVLTVALPAGALAAALTFELGRPRWRLILLPILLTVLAGELLVSVPMVTSRSGFESAIDYLRARGVTRVMSTQPTIAAFYLSSRAQVRFGPASEDQLRDAWEDGYRYLLVDEQGYIAGPSRSLLERIERTLSPEFAVEDTFKMSPAYYLEQDPTGLSFDAREALFHQTRRLWPTAQVKIYQITDEFMASLGLDTPTDSRSVMGPELLKNPGFEAYDPSGPTGWQKYGNPIFDASGSKSHGGKAAVCTRGDSEGGYVQTVAVTSGTEYLLLEWVIADSGSDETARVQVNWLAADGAFAGVSLQVTPALVGEWRQRHLRAVAPPNAVNANVYVAVHQAARVCFDDLSFVALSH